MMIEWMTIPLRTITRKRSKKMTENDHELTTKTFAFVDTIDDFEI